MTDRRTDGRGIAYTGAYSTLSNAYAFALCSEDETFKSIDKANSSRSLRTASLAREAEITNVLHVLHLKPLRLVLFNTSATKCLIYCYDDDDVALYLAFPRSRQGRFYGGGGMSNACPKRPPHNAQRL